MALFELADLAAYLQRTLDTTSATLARTVATGIVTGYTNQGIEAATYTQTLPISTGLTIRLPQRPVTAVTSVTIDGTAWTVTDQWLWDGISYQVDLEEPPPVDVWTARVVYNAGYATVPGLVKAVALSVAARAYTNPSRVSSQSIDDYQVSYPGESAGLLPEEKRLLKRYRVMAGTVAPSGGNLNNRNATRWAYSQSGFSR
jgi:hypothetical protein